MSSQNDDAPSPEDAIFVAIRTLVSSLKQSDKEILLKELSEAISPIPTPRAGDLLTTIIRILPKNQEWTVTYIKKRIGDLGMDPKDKEIYNAIGYLTRKKHIKRLGYGRYIIDGIPITTADDLGGQSSLTEGDLDD